MATNAFPEIVYHHYQESLDRFGSARLSLSRSLRLPGDNGCKLGNWCRLYMRRVSRRPGGRTVGSTNTSDDGLNVRQISPHILASSITFGGSERAA